MVLVITGTAQRCRHIGNVGETAVPARSKLKR